MIVPSNVKQTPIRIPDEIKTWVKELAAQNGRSLNTEIVFLLKKAKEENENEKH